MYETLKSRTMKKRRFLLLIGEMAMFQLNAHVTLINPKGGQAYHPGDTMSIQWREVVSHNTLNWDLFFSSDGGITWDTLETDIPLEKLNYPWIVPSIATLKGKIKVVQDNIDYNYEGISKDFTVFEFENPGHESHTLSFYDIQGRPVREIKNITSDRVEIRRENWISGFYFYTLLDGKKIRARGKLEVQ